MTAFELSVATLTLVIIYTTSIVGLAVWLANKFRSLEQTFYKELNGHRRNTITELRKLADSSQAMALRIQRIELKAFGFTEVPSTLPPSYTIEEK